MGLNSAKFSLPNRQSSLKLSLPHDMYRLLSTIEGEFQLNIHSKLSIENKIHIDLVGQLINKRLYSARLTKKVSTQSNKDNVFFTYSCPIVTSHENGIARTIKRRRITFPFRIPLSNNLPPSCEFEEFSVIYYIDVYHDGRLLPSIRKEIKLTPSAPVITTPSPCKVTGCNDVDVTCSLQKPFYSGRDGSIAALSISIKNPKQKQIQTVTAQLVRIVSLNEFKFENEIDTYSLKEINENTREAQIDTIWELKLPSGLPSTYVPNESGRPDNVPCIAILHELRITVQLDEETASNLRLSVPISIE